MNLVRLLISDEEQYAFLTLQMGNVRLFMILTAVANPDIIEPRERLVNPGVAV